MSARITEAMVEAFFAELKKRGAPLPFTEDARAALAAALSTESGEAGADRKRLDFLDQCSARLNAYYGTTYGWKLILNHNVNRLMLGHLEVDLNDAVAHGVTSCRSAIDAEMKRTTAAPLPEDTHHGR